MHRICFFSLSFSCCFVHSIFQYCLMHFHLHFKCLFVFSSFFYSHTDPVYLHSLLIFLRWFTEIQEVFASWRGVNCCVVIVSKFVIVLCTKKWLTGKSLFPWYQFMAFNYSSQLTAGWYHRHSLSNALFHHHFHHLLPPLLFRRSLMLSFYLTEISVYSNFMFIF